MSIITHTVMALPYLLKKLLKKLKKNIRPLNGRVYISKLLIKLPKSLFPDYRIIVNPVIVKSNRRTLNILGDVALPSVNSRAELNDSLTPERESKYCRRCSRLYYRQNSITSNDEFSLPQIRYSTPIKTWSDEVEEEFEASMGVKRIPFPPPMPEGIALDDELFNKAPLRRITIGDIKSVKLKPAAMTLNTPEVNDLESVLRKRYSAMHSTFLDDVTMINNCSGEDFSLVYTASP